MGCSLSESVFQTILKRKGLVLRLISEIKVTLEDCRSNKVGGLVVGLEIWKKAVLPYLYNNSSCWVEMPKKVFNLLISITHSFYRSLFFAPKGTPIFSFYWDTGHLLEDNFLMKEKLLLLFHLATLPDTALAKEAYMIQKQDANIPGLVRECEEYLRVLKITEDPTHFTKAMWKKTISKAIHSKNRKDLLTLLESYKKLDKEKLMDEEYGEKRYLKTMNISSARTFFSARASMLSTIKANFKGDPRYAADNYVCDCGEHQDTQSGLLTCRLYEKQRQDLDILGCDEHLVLYYQRVIAERLKEREKNE